MQFILFLMISIIVFCVPALAETHTLAKDSKTDYLIILSDKATIVEQTAAKELKEYLDAITGANYPIVKESEIDETKPQILIGNTLCTKKLLPNIEVTKIKYDGIVIKSVGNKIEEQEGNQAGLMIRFVNKIAKELEMEFPDVWFETLAYQYTRKAPKLVKPRKNVVVRLCSIECSFLQPLEKVSNNFLNDLKAWSRITDNLFIWDYVTNFSGYMLPQPNLRILAPNIRLFVNHNVIGLLEQSDAYCLGGDFCRMRAWVISHLLWNPEQDENQLFDTFLNGYYGTDSAPFLKQY